MSRKCFLCLCLNFSLPVTQVLGCVYCCLCPCRSGMATASGSRRKTMLLWSSTWTPAKQSWPKGVRATAGKPCSLKSWYGGLERLEDEGTFQSTAIINSPGARSSPNHFEQCLQSPSRSGLDISIYHLLFINKYSCLRQTCIRYPSESKPWAEKVRKINVLFRSHWEKTETYASHRDQEMKAPGCFRAQSRWQFNGARISGAH